MPFRRLKPNPNCTAQDALDQQRRIRLGADDAYDRDWPGPDRRKMLERWSAEGRKR